MDNVDLNIMKECYGYLFEIENYLRGFIKHNMEFRYGSNWELISRKLTCNSITNRKLSDLYFYELISFISLFECLYVEMSSENIVKLSSLSPIRNKIAHNIWLEKDEVDTLYNIYHEIMKR